MKDLSDKKTKIEQVLHRGIEAVYPKEASFGEILESNKKLKIYYGIDPTGESLHIGHGSCLLKLKELQDLGHEITILIGDFTATIGDPTGKSAVRNKLTLDEVKKNCEKYKEQIENILDLNKTSFVFNNDWVGKLSFAEVIELASEFTVGQMIERDMFQERIKKEEPIYLHEFLYPLIQGYDSVVLDTDVEVGGSDQTFNMLTGRTMLKRRGKEKFVLVTKLLTDPVGKKMGKSEGNMVSFLDAPEDMYGKVMSWPDSLMPLAYEICTRVPEVEIDQLLSGDPKEAKMRLAKEIVSIFTSSEKAEKAEEDFTLKFQKKEIPDSVLEVSVLKGSDLATVLIENNLIGSKSEFKRLVDGGGVTFNGEKIVNTPSILIEEGVIKVGKHRFLRIKIT